MNQHVTLANWRAAPFNRWGFQHVRELIPTADIPNDPHRVRDLPVQKRSIELRVEPDTGEPLTLERFLAETDTDGLVILHRGRVVAEHYANGMTAQTPHILMSVSKSMMALVFGLLGRVIEGATGRRYADLASEHLWKPIGAERSAYITVDRLGAPRCAGGMCVTVRDLARVGQWTIEQPSRWIEDIEKNGDRTAWDKGSFVQYFPGLPIHYRSQWYVLP